MQVNALLDNRQPYDEPKVKLLDTVVDALYSGNSARVLLGLTVDCGGEHHFGASSG